MRNSGPPRPKSAEFLFFPVKALLRMRIALGSLLEQLFQIFQSKDPNGSTVHKSKHRLLFGQKSNEFKSSKYYFKDDQNLSCSNSDSILPRDKVLTTVISELNTSQSRHWTWADNIFIIVWRKEDFINLPPIIVRIISPSSIWEEFNLKRVVCSTSVMTNNSLWFPYSALVPGIPPP